VRLTKSIAGTLQCFRKRVRLVSPELQLNAIKVAKGDERPSDLFFHAGMRDADPIEVFDPLVEGGAIGHS
jgi:hypothetical protein